MFFHHPPHPPPPPPAVTCTPFWMHMKRTSPFSSTQDVDLHQSPCIWVTSSLSSSPSELWSKASVQFGRQWWWWLFGVIVSLLHGNDVVSNSGTHHSSVSMCNSCCVTPHAHTPHAGILYHPYMECPLFCLVARITVWHSLVDCVDPFPSNTHIHIPG